MEQRSSGLFKTVVSLDCEISSLPNKKDLALKIGHLSGRGVCEVHICVWIFGRDECSRLTDMHIRSEFEGMSFDPHAAFAARDRWRLIEVRGGVRLAFGLSCPRGWLASTIAPKSDVPSGSRLLGSRYVRASPFIEPEQTLGFSRNSDPYAPAYSSHWPD